MITLLLLTLTSLTWGIPTYDTDMFTFSCLPLTIQRSDPIVSPGKVSDHTHAVVGGTAFQQTMGVNTAKNSEGTTCGVAIDRSNYWIPQLYHHRKKDGKFEIVEFQGSSIYYMNRACNYTAGATSCDYADHYPLAPPPGLRMVAGNPNYRKFDESDVAQRAISHMCLEKDGLSKEVNHLPRQSCSRLRSQVFFPSCWDGKNLDSADHHSHMAYPEVGEYNKGVCPQSHPVAIYSIFFEFFFNTAPYPDYQNWIYSSGDQTGYGLHGDFINGWDDQAALQRALATCSGKNGIDSPNCSITKSQKRKVAPISLKPQVPGPNEDVGQGGPIPELLGQEKMSMQTV